MPVAVQLSLLGLYLPPVLNEVLKSYPPQTIISLPFHTAVCLCRPLGALLVLVAVQLSLLGLSLPPVLLKGAPPQTIISLPVHTAVCWPRSVGALVRFVGVHVSLEQSSGTEI